MVITKTWVTLLQFPNFHVFRNLSYTSLPGMLYLDIALPHVLTSFPNCHTFTSGIIPAKFAAYRNTFLSATLAFQSHNQIPSNKYQLIHLKTPKYTKIHIILSSWGNYTGEVVHRLPFSTINVVQSMPLNLKIH